MDQLNQIKEQISKFSSPYALLSPYIIKHKHIQTTETYTEDTGIQTECIKKNRRMRGLSVEEFESSNEWGEEID